jgi:hypothetical protein
MMIPNGYHSSSQFQSQQSEMNLKSNGLNFQTQNLSPFMSHANSGCNSPDKKDGSHVKAKNYCPISRHFEQFMKLDSQAN